MEKLFNPITNIMLSTYWLPSYTIYGHYFHRYIFLRAVGDHDFYWDTCIRAIGNQHVKKHICLWVVGDDSFYGSIYFPSMRDLGFHWHICARAICDQYFTYNIRIQAVCVLDTYFGDNCLIHHRCICLRAMSDSRHIYSRGTGDQNVINMFVAELCVTDIQRWSN